MKHGLLPKFITVFLTAVFLLLGSVPQSQADKVTFYHNDHLGSPLAMTDMQGNVVWRRDYKPFGQEVDPGGETAANTHKYTGKEYDAETGLYYYGARYYDPTIGRFLSVDPVGGKPNDPQTWNRYIYTLNNPYKYVDPDGEFAVLGIMAGLALAHGIAWGGSQIAAKWAGDPVQPSTIKHLDYRLSNAASDLILVNGFASVLGAGAIGGAAEMGASSYTEFMVAAGSPQGQKVLQNAGDFIAGIVPGTTPNSPSGYLGSGMGLAVDWLTKQKAESSISQTGNPVNNRHDKKIDEPEKIMKHLSVEHIQKSDSPLK